MAEEAAAAHHLLNILEERDLHVDLDQVLEAFENEDTKKEMAAWVNEHLNSETLLTKEELELYQTLKKKGVVHLYENDEAPIRPVLDHELSSAIDSLESSTAAIEEQCRVLEAQRDALMALKALDKPNLSVEHMRNERRRRENQEKARLDIAVEDVATSINEQLTDTQREVEAEKSSVISYVTERLASDDKMLANLPGIVSKIMAEPEVSEDEKSIDQWCQAIISFRTAEIKARVDAVYLDNLGKDLPVELQNMPENELLERKAEIRKELEDMHSEIAYLAESAVERELKKPITELKERKERERVEARVAWLKYVLSTLDYMSERLDTITIYTTKIDDFRHALDHVKAAALQHMPTSNVEALTPSRKRTMSTPKSPLSTIVKLKPSKSVDLPPALEDALRQAGISFNHDSIESLMEALMNTQLEREKKLDDHYTSASSSTHESLAEVFGKADIKLRLILGALYSHTPFRQVHLSNPKLEEQLKEMEKGLEDADRKLLNAEANELSLNDPRVKAFISKYGSER
ncbi:uncharacterized protein BDR25DRAFT_278437 [Lindgomyces ingoldianus]|uniref:Uncharacterized protein n=1 Tax=Lindgomyces ingoldianus TaxID=673940 RepID=A0ACB6R9C9_9PLEO|nr:uncharacterized protein BDR25DRAFT_278437 [Lindgomyces ingoldianus]KAF2475786.1 hypothetical protein BDR25DRAFT_278437 [Lindgomyces ingoldianus]